jgi:hypothetical protein
VKVHGDPIAVPYGEKAVFTRTATVKRAGPLERAWTKATGDIEFMELLEFSFSSEMNYDHRNTVADATRHTEDGEETTMLSPRFYTTDFDDSTAWT